MKQKYTFDFKKENVLFEVSKCRESRGQSGSKDQNKGFNKSMCNCEKCK